jgi:hypothetical protein
VYRACKAHGMTHVTISDHNTLEGALRIAELPDTFLSVEVTTRFPEDDVPLHVLVWNLTEEDHRDLQPLRPSVYELAAFLRERGLAHALAHPLYRMGPPLTIDHVERMMLIFGTWEGRNGARSRESNELACRLAAAVTPEYLVKLAERHRMGARRDERRRRDDAASRAVAASAVATVARAPRAALALAHEVRGLDLHRECARIRAAGIPVSVVGCVSDTLVTCEHTRRLAELLGGTYEELDSAGGHMWMLSERERFAAALA